MKNIILVCLFALFGATAYSQNTTLVKHADIYYIQTENIFDYEIKTFKLGDKDKTCMIIKSLIRLIEMNKVGYSADMGNYIYEILDSPDGKCLCITFDNLDSKIYISNKYLKSIINTI